MIRNTHRLAVTLLIVLASAAAEARVISYSPYTDRAAVPAAQHRLNRHFVLIEGVAENNFFGPMPILIPPAPYGMNGQVVVYDFTGAEEPRVVFPANGSLVPITAAAARENAQGVLSILIQTTADFEGGNPQKNPIWLLTTNSGATWRRVTNIPSSLVYHVPYGLTDFGGPYAGGRTPVRIGTDAVPFVVAVQNSIWSVSADGTGRSIFTSSSPSSSVSLAGSNLQGSQFLARTPEQLFIVDTTGASRAIATIQTVGSLEGWITPAGGVYFIRHAADILVGYIEGNNKIDIISIPSSTPTAAIAIPTFDYTGGWISTRANTGPTSLYRHSPSTGLVKQWDDITAPQVEALHAGSSGNKVLIQVHRPRPQPDQRLFIDPALAVWRVGQPAPRRYDELFLNEQPDKGFVHLDVERIEEGDPFVFNSGLIQNSWGGPVISPMPVGGGGDVVQEWGVVRGSLKQRLIIPAVARTPGAYGSFWSSDVIVQNPLETRQTIRLRFVPTGGVVSTAAEQTAVLEPREIRLFADVVKSLFGLENGSGSILITPDEGVTATSRTFSRSDSGTFGFGMNAVDALAGSASPRFPLTFSGAFPGPNFRTNLSITDTSGRGTDVQLIASGNSGAMGRSDLVVSADADGQQSLNNVRETLFLAPHETGALMIRPTRGNAIASVIAIDNATNDATYFPPDLPATTVRTIPAVVHLEGANGANFRSDLFLFNPSDEVKVVTIQAKLWDSTTTQQPLQLTLLPREARVIKDVLKTAFGLTGTARLRYQALGEGSGIRATSRTYTVDANGATYGFLLPPLNNFQAGGSGDTLEILGAVSDPNYRTNIGLIELTAFANAATVNVRVEIIDSLGRSVDTFTVTVNVAGGTQLNDIFRARDINITGPALIRVTPLNGIIGAYATTIDNRTNDALYLGANLAATE
jgi:hypothetical protein